MKVKIKKQVIYNLNAMRVDVWNRLEIEKVSVHENNKDPVNNDLIYLKGLMDRIEATISMVEGK